ncbi:lipopolysaccharide heptosyltransferase II [Candidatus Omnitrophota bacterium]
MKKILVFATNWLGDTLFLFPLLDGLRHNFRQSSLAVVSVPRVKGIFANNRNVEEIIVYDEKGRHRGLFSRIALISQLRKKGFDTAFMIKPSLSRALILKLAGIKEIIGFANPKSGWLLTKQIPQPDKALHKIDSFLSILQHLKFKVEQRRYEFLPYQEEKTHIENLLRKKGFNPDLPLLVINPGANWFPKRWPPENFAELVKRLKSGFRLNVAITGAEKDRELSGKIIEQSGADILDFTGQTTFGQLGALMQRADIVISADSGPMHIAAAVGKKVIALFGPTSAKLTGPYPPEEHIIIQGKPEDCRVPCYDSSCRDYRCMKSITVDEVFQKVTQLLKVK